MARKIPSGDTIPQGHISSLLAAGDTVGVEVEVEVEVLKRKGGHVNEERQRHQMTQKFRCFAGPGKPSVLVTEPKSAGVYCCHSCHSTENKSIQIQLNLYKNHSRRKKQAKQAVMSVSQSLKRYLMQTPEHQAILPMLSEQR